jgi:hypothetical protein
MALPPNSMHFPRKGMDLVAAGAGKNIQRPGSHWVERRLT